jgi:hypothetical protein
MECLSCSDDALLCSNVVIVEEELILDVLELY